MDTPAYARLLRAAGVAEHQAKAEALAAAVEGQVATKAEVREMATKADPAELRADLLRWMIGLAIAQCALLVSIVSLRP